MQPIKMNPGGPEAFHLLSKTRLIIGKSVNPFLQANNYNTMIADTHQIKFISPRREWNVQRDAGTDQKI